MYVGTKSSEKVIDLITNGRFCNAVCKMSPAYQTSSLEAFHSVVNHFAPKSVAFSYEGMLAWLVKKIYYEFEIKITVSCTSFQ